MLSTISHAQASRPAGVVPEPDHRLPSFADTVRSELIRLSRPAFLYGGGALVVGLTALATTLVHFAGDNPFAGDLQLTGLDGLLAGPRLSIDMVSIAVMAMCAAATAIDHRTGLIRLLVQAEPRRWRLVLAKSAALAMVVAAWSLLAVLGSGALAMFYARFQDVDTSAWLAEPGTVMVAVIGVIVGTVAFGLLGQILATTTRSATIAIAAGAAYLFVVENLLSTLFDLDLSVLPGDALLTIAREAGTGDIATATTVAALWIVSGLAVVIAVVTGRDVTD